MNRLKAFFARLVFSDDLPLDARILNMVCLFGVVAAVLSMIARLIEGSGPLTALAMSGMIVSIVILLYVANRFRLHQFGIWITLILLGDILFPIVFFTEGGADSGMAAYYVLSIVIIFLLVSGRSFVILFSLHVVCITACYLINARYPWLIRPLGSLFARYFNIIQSTILAGAFIGTVGKFQNIIFMREKRRADDASRAKSDFLANMSHEMRTPMNAIIGMTAIAMSAKDSERKDYCLKKIDDASNHLLGVINDILDMSKIEANKFELSSAEFNFEKMLMKVTNVVNFRVAEKRQRFTVHIDGKIPRMLVGDDQRISQVITNLLSNAIKFTPEEGAVRLETRLIKEERGACLIETSVTDSGIGVSEEQRQRLFGSFEQADSGISRKFGGTGLGLAISKRIVEMMDGRIWVESELGHGARFVFTILARRGSEHPKSLLNPNVNWNNVRLLAVDDMPEIRDFFDEIAQRLGVSCDIAKNGEEAIKLIEKRGAYDIYFVDWAMPGMDGVELARRIRGNAARNAEIIIISATDWTQIEAEAKGAGVTRFLQKPLFISTIVDCVNDCLGSTLIKTNEEALLDGNVDLFSGYRLILAEDVEINREIVLTLLEPTALEIVCAENGAAALALYREAPESFDLIFMDIHMPEMDGYEATRRIRALNSPGAKQIPIIAMTANVFREDIEKCLDAGMNDHVGKPLDFDEVLKKLRKYLPRQTGAVKL